MRRILILSALYMIGTGCGSPSIDSSSEESFKRSFTALRESLPADRQQELDAAILELAFEDLDLADLASAGSDPEAAALKFRMPLDGLTAEQILEKAALLRQEREAKQRDEALKEVEELEEKRRKGDRDTAELAKIEITRSRFYKTKENYVTKPVIELRVKNGSEHSIARLYFKGTIASPGRAVPWLREDFNYAIKVGARKEGGIGPGAVLVAFDGCDHLEACFLKAQREPSGPRKQLQAIQGAVLEL